MLLSKKTRQEYLKYLGLYTGAIDGIEGAKTKKAYKDLQNKYFTRTTDKDGKYGNNTDILLRNAYNVARLCKNFKLEEFKCNCKGKYCTGYPAILSEDLLKNVQSVRDKYGATTITSPLRCQKFNDSLTGSVKNSRHIKGKAVDIYVAKNKTLEGRKEVINYWFTLNNPNYGYCNGFYRYGKSTGNYTASNMGTSTHLDVK